MKKKTYLFVAGITVTCGTALAIHLSQPKSIPMTKSGHEKMISKSPTNSDDKSRKKIRVLLVLIILLVMDLN
ncbi:hypothetical protein VBG66_06580 [Streptococcus uberis]|uniref:hypothetical protein n=1 Tax=Streptococcus uberis TaxID=1349 RepID=UPI003787D0EE